MPAIIFQSSRLSSVLPKKNPIAHPSGLSSEAASPAATTLPVSSTQEPIGRTQEVRPIGFSNDYRYCHHVLLDSDLAVTVNWSKWRR